MESLFSSNSLRELQNILGSLDIRINGVRINQVIDRLNDVQSQINPSYSNPSNSNSSINQSTNSENSNENRFYTGNRINSSSDSLNRPKNQTTLGLYNILDILSKLIDNDKWKYKREGNILRVYSTDGDIS